MRTIVKKDKLIKIIKRNFNFYDDEQINTIINEYGASYFNRYSNLNITYLGFGAWELTI